MADFYSCKNMHVYYYVIFCLLVSPLSLVFSDERFLQYSACCTFTGPDLEHIEYDLVNRVNNKVLITFNSTRGNWTGYTVYAQLIAEELNTDPVYAIRRAFEMKVLCSDNKHLVKQIRNLTAAPAIKLKSVKHPPMLVCSAYNFYPKQIKVTWMRNEQEVTSAVSFSEVMPDRDWYYQIHSYLEYTPTSGEKIACMVEHLSLAKPVLHVWESSSLAASEQIQIIMGTVLLVLGFVSMIAGFIYYRKKSGAHVIPCQGRVLVPVDDHPTAGAT